MFKKLIKKMINSMGYNINKFNNEIKNINFDELLKEKIQNNPVIFDVGANSGQSIMKYKKIFQNPTIHSFEPIKKEFELISTRFGNDKNIFLNNFALGDKAEFKELNVTAKSSNSSFIKIKEGTEWLDRRSKDKKTSPQKYSEVQKVKIETLDQYCRDKKIDQIDLLKIDTQGYEDKVLLGSQETINKNKVNVIIVEIMFDNVYEKYFSFSDIEKFIKPSDFRMVGIDLMNNNLFSGLVFFADVYYFNKKTYNL